MADIVVVGERHPDIVAVGERHPDIVVVGELNPDIVVAGVPDLEAPRGLDQVEDLVASTTLTLGSSAAITAVAAARAGAPTALVAVVGDDAMGRLCQEWVSGDGVDIRHVRVDPDAPTGSTVILVAEDDATRRRMLTHLGAMAALRVDDIDLAAWAGATHLHVSSFFMHTGAREHLHEVFAAARAQGLVTSLDTNDDPDDTWDAGAQSVLPVCDLVFCNEREARGLAGKPAGAILDVARRLLDRLPRGDDPRLPAVVLKLGGEGAVALTDAGAVSVRAPDVEVVDTVGAGDTLAGTVLAALLAGSDWDVALPWGVAAATHSTTAAGGTGAGPAPGQVQAAAQSLPIQDTRSATPAP